jgi:hypothetical protein
MGCKGGGRRGAINSAGAMDEGAMPVVRRREQTVVVREDAADRGHWVG